MLSPPRRAKHVNVKCCVGVKPRRIWPSPTKMIYQLSWKILPGLRGLACSEFRGVATATPDNERGVAVEFATEAERDAFLPELEEHFSAQRFSNNAAAFEAVKAYVLGRVARPVNE